MASAVFRLPSTAPYGYVEVTLDQDDLDKPSEWRVELLETLRADLEQVLPVPTPGAAAAAYSAPASNVPEFVNGAKTTCDHGQRVQVARSNWTAWFCPLKDKNAQCKAEFEKKGN